MEAARPAAREDAERCAELCRTALAEISEAGLLAKALLRPGGLDSVMAAPRRRVLVGTIDDVVVGLAVGRIDDVGEAGLGVIDACYVEPAARGVGVGRSLLDALVSWFSSTSCRAVDAGALPGDRRTKNFFEAAGFKARLITLHRPLR